MIDPTLIDGVRPYPTRAILYPDGRIVKREGKIPHADIEAIICDPVTDRSRVLTIVNLRDGHVMLVHDLGHGAMLALPSLEENAGATAAYHATCYPGTKHTIVGVAVIVPDEDFA